MKRVLCCCLLLFAVINNNYATISSTLFNALQKAINESSAYDAGKQTDITKIKQSLSDAGNNNLLRQADITSQLYEAYKTFNYDSALLYAKRLQMLSYSLQDNARIVDAKIKISFILISAALFKDAFDSLHTIHVSGLPDSIKAGYYSLMGRAYYDLGDFNNDNTYTPEYYHKGSLYLDSALSCFPASSFDYAYYKGLRNLKMGNISQAQSILINILRKQGLTYHQKALTESTLGGTYMQTGEIDKQTALLTAAAIDDIKSSTKETTATLYLSSLLFKKNKIKDALLCVEKAMQDATFYGARLRQIQASSILPIIEGARVNIVENQRKDLILYSSVATLLLLLLAGLIVFIFRQNKKLKLAKQTITEANRQQLEINRLLMEANKIKEEYMIHSYNISADFFTKMERLRNAIERKIHNHKFEEIKFLLNSMDLKADKHEMLAGFDKVFLKLFPHFVDDFNSMFGDEDKSHLNEDGSLSTGLRIFALMRMGITDNEKIAQILEYSVNTIYTYKTKFKKKALVPAKEFDEIIMKSKAL